MRRNTETSAFWGDIQIIFPAFSNWERMGGGFLLRKTPNYTPNASNLFLSRGKSARHIGFPPSILKRMVVMLNFFVSLFIYFWHLTAWGGGASLFYTPEISVLKSCLFSVLTSWMSASILFKKLPCPSNCRSVDVWLLIFLLLSFKESVQMLLLIKSKPSQCTQSDAGFFALGNFFFPFLNHVQMS